MNLKLIITSVAIAVLAMSFVSNIQPNSIQQKAKAENKNIAIYFSGSDWCSICHHFKKKVLEVKTADSLLNKHFVYYNADFPQRKKLADSTRIFNEALAEKLNTDGIFPLLVIVDADFNVKNKIRGNASIEEVIKVLSKELTSY